MQESKTLNYYDEKTQEFIESTVNVDFKETQDKFLKLLAPKAYILDFGCGSGRDTKYFLEQGFQVTAIDGSAELCKFASVLTGIEVKQMFFQELSEIETYDGIWACSSILHLPYAELQDVFLKMVKAVKNGGVIYTSFKYGNFEGYRNERYFTDMDEAKFTEFIKDFPEIEVE
ncbi:MAG: class I SAM-dependent methyltransferase, partial [Phascolarctobacterium sp.]|nr:class I SAM-dependent methyltransferase [Phascolarctobacterium sp.]